MRMNDIEIFKIIVEEGLDSLYRNDSILINQNCHERSIVFRLACYMKTNEQNSKFSVPYDIDVEYNRRGIDPKLLNFEKENNLKLIVPDIIFHLRNETNNLAVIEVKVKNYRPNEFEKDIEKIKLLTTDEEYLYKIGVFLFIESHQVTLKYFENGIEVDERIIHYN
jgi:hypothetical protein